MANYLRTLLIKNDVKDPVMAAVLEKNEDEKYTYMVCPIFKVMDENSLNYVIVFKPMIMREFNASSDESAIAAFDDRVRDSSATKYPGFNAITWNGEKVGMIGDYENNRSCLVNNHVHATYGIQSCEFVCSHLDVFVIKEKIMNDTVIVTFDCNSGKAISNERVPVGLV